MGKTYRAGSSHNKFSRRDFDKKSKFFKKFKQKDKPRLKPLEELDIPPELNDLQ